MKTEVDMYVFDDVHKNIAKFFVNGIISNFSCQLLNLKDSDGNIVEYSGKVDASLRIWCEKNTIRCTRHRIEFDIDNKTMFCISTEHVVDFPKRKMDKKFDVVIMTSDNKYEHISTFTTYEQATYFIHTAGPNYPKSTVFKITEIYTVV